MILVFNTLSKEKAAWSAIKNGKILGHKNFVIGRGEDKSLQYLQKFLGQENLKLASFKGILLTIQDASLTQVKVFTNNINTLGWQLDMPVLASYYYQTEEYDKILQNLLKKIAQLKKFKAIKADYKYKTQISISKKHPKYKINK